MSYRGDLGCLRFGYEGGISLISSGSECARICQNCIHFKPVKIAEPKIETRCSSFTTLEEYDRQNHNPLAILNKKSFVYKRSS